MGAQASWVFFLAAPGLGRLMHPVVGVVAGGWLGCGGVLSVA